MAVKKTSTKKTTAKKPAIEKKRAPVREYSYDILDEAHEGVGWEVKDGLDRIFQRRKNKPTGFIPMDAVRHVMLPLREFIFQWFIGAYGLTDGSVIEIIGQTGLGKSTLAMWLMGGAMLRGIPCAFLESEGKAMKKSWMLRALHPNRKVAKAMLSRVGFFEKARTLNQMEEYAEEWVKYQRGHTTPANPKPVPMDTPLFLVVDSVSKMLPPNEAAGYSDYGGAGDSSKKKAAGAGSNFTHAKWMAAWMRRAPTMFKDNNVYIVFISHQTTKVDMSGGGASFLPETAQALYNTTKVGGAALGQNAALQIVLAHKALAKDSAGNKIGAVIQARVSKNSYGPNNRNIEWVLKNDEFQDTLEATESPLQFAPFFAHKMADKGWLGTKVLRKRYTCDRIGATNATAEEFNNLFNASAEARNELGLLLDIDGYDDIVDRIKKEEKADADT